MYTTSVQSVLQRLYRATAAWLVFMLVFGVAFNVVPQLSIDTDGNFSLEQPIGEALASVPSVSIASTTDITATTATSNGEITAEGGDRSTIRGFRYSTDPTFATGVSTTTEVSGAYDISTATYDSVALDVTARDSFTSEILFNDDGTTLYVLGADDADVHAYTLSTAYDISTATYDSVVLDVSSQEFDPRDLLFNDDGTTLYITGTISDVINAYTLTTAYDISTATFDSIALDVATEEDSSTSMLFNDDGTTLYLMGFFGQDINAYSLTTAYDISTATFDSVVLDVSSQEINPFDMLFNDDGTLLYVIGSGGDDINAYTLTTAYDISTATFDSIALDVSGEDDQPTAMLFNDDGTTLYIMGLGTGNSYIHSYSISGPYTTGTYAQDITNLTFGTTYYVQAFAENSTGLAYSVSSDSFTTDEQPSSFTTADSGSSWIVPAGVNEIKVNAWGAGGGGGGGGTSGAGGTGGAGGYQEATIDVTPGETLTVRVGGGGGAGDFSTGGGGAASGDGGGGGGYSALLRGSDVLVLAAGGGGGGGGDNSSATAGGAGGAGGGTVGVAGSVSGSASGGGAGTQSTGGTAGTTGLTPGAAGSSLAGGDGANGENGGSTQGGMTNGGTNGGAAGGTGDIGGGVAGAGGGGAGYFGGGGGAASVSSDAGGGGGGGGSSFATSTATDTTTESGSGTSAPKTGDPSYEAGAGTGGTGGATSGSGTAGSDGLLVITSGGATWNSTDWTDYVELIIPASNVGEDLTDFPVYVDLANMPSHFWENVTASCGDIRVTDNAGTPNELAREVVSCTDSGSTGSGELHFKAASLSSTTDSVFRIYYGNGSATDYLDAQLFGTHNVWTNDYIAVWHLEEDPTGSILDSTSNNNDGTSIGSMVAGDLSTAQLGSGLVFDGTNQMLDFGDIDALDTFSEASFSIWAYRTTDNAASTNHNVDNVFFAQSTDSGNDNFEFGTDGTSYEIYGDTAGADAEVSISSDVANDVWFHSSYIYDENASEEASVYKDGMLVGSTATYGGAHSNSGASLTVGGARPETSLWGEFIGTLDEARVASVPRTSGWIATEYENQLNPTRFYEVNEPGNEFADGGWSDFVTLTINADKVDDDVTDFPVYVDLANMPSHFWENVTASCGDIRVTDNAGTPNELAREVVSCTDSGSTGSGELHFKAASLSSTTDSVFRIYYGNSTSTDYLVNSTYGAQNVWTNGYQAVYHMDSTGSLVDSTSNARDGSVVGAVGTGGGQLGSSFDFADSTADYATMPSDFAIDSVDHSVQFWFNTDSVAQDTTSTNADIPLSFYGQERYFLTFGDSEAADTLGLRFNDGAWKTVITQPNVSTDDIWYNWSHTFDASSGDYVLYSNGAQIDTATDAGGYTDDTGTNAIAVIDGPSRPYDGKIDEVRVSSVIRSSGWVATEYENQSDPSSFYSLSDTVSGWNEVDWTDRVAINIQSSEIGSTLTDFPVYVDLSDLPAAFWGGVASDGRDIRVTNSSGTELPIEIVSVDPFFDGGELHFKADSISDTTDTTFYIYYNNPSAVAYPENYVYGAQAVWSNGYAGVWHLDEGGNTDVGGFKDATANGNDGTGVSFPVFAEVGQVGNSRPFSGIDDSIEVPADSSLEFTESMTMSAWVKKADPQSDNFGSVLRYGDSSFPQSYAMNLNGSDDVLRSTFGNNPRNITEGTPIAASTWEHFTGVWNNGTKDASYYSDGVEYATVSSSTFSIGGYGSGFLSIGINNNGFNDFTGSIDEIRLSSAARSADWVAAEYANQDSPRTFYLIDESDNEWNDTDWTEYVGLTIPADNVNDDLTDFPVYVDLADMSEPFWEGVRADCGDIRITTDVDVPTELAREIVSCTDSGSSGTGELHFKAVSLSSTTDTVFRIYYGNASSTDYVENSRYGAESVWSNGYVGVWHLDEDGNTDPGGFKDATANGNDGTGSGFTDSGRVGQVGNMRSFNGTSEWITVPADPSLEPSEDITIGLWSNKAATQNDSFGRTLQYENGFPSAYFSNNTESDRATFLGGAGSDSVVSGHGPSAPSTWSHQMAVWDDSAKTLSTYTEGDLFQSVSSSTFSLSYDGSGGLGIGAWPSGVQKFTGDIDEVRIASVARSAAWIEAEYDNQSGLTAFYQVDVTPNEWNEDEWTAFDTITIFAENIDETLTDFPVYVDLGDLSTAFWDTVRSDGGDIRVTTDDGTSVELAREVVFASTTVRTGELHFKAPVVSSTTDTSFRIYYNGISGDYQTNASYGAENVWSNGYVAVYHLDDPYSTESGNYTDSTSNRYEGSLTDADGDSARSGGQLGGALDFDGDADFISTNIPWSTDESDVTVSFWNNVASAEVKNSSAFGSHNGTDRIASHAPFSDNTIFWDYGDIDSGGRVSGSYADYTDKWTHVNMVYRTAPSTLRGIYLDGTLEYSNTTTLEPVSTFTDFYIGSAVGSTFHEGDIDEFRLASVARSTAWINAEYVNQSTTTDFYGLTASTQATSTATLANHTAGQVSDLFDFKNVTNGELYAYRLTPNSGTATVTRTTLIVSDWEADRLDTSDFSNIRLYRDTDNDAHYDVGDELLSSSGFFDIYGTDAAQGRLVFTDTYTITTGSNYLVVADWDRPARGSEVTFAITGDSILVSNTLGPVTVSGEADALTHTRANGGGGGGGGAAAIGGDAPAGDGDVGGGGAGGGGAIDTNTGGGLIGNEPDFNWPTAGSGAWSNIANAYDQTDGTYATTDAANNADFTDYTHGVPSSDTIEGIEVKLELSGTTDAGTIDVSLSWDGGTTWTSTQSSPTLTTSDTVITLGGPSDLWGRTWTTAETSDANFAVRLTGAPSSNTVQVDALQVKIFHQASGGSGGGGGAI